MTDIHDYFSGKLFRSRKRPSVKLLLWFTSVDLLQPSLWGQEGRIPLDTRRKQYRCVMITLSKLCSVASNGAPDVPGHSQTRKALQACLLIKVVQFQSFKSLNHECQNAELHSEVSFLSCFPFFTPCFAGTAVGKGLASPFQHFLLFLSYPCPHEAVFWLLLGWDRLEEGEVGVQKGSDHSPAAFSGLWASSGHFLSWMHLWFFGDTTPNENLLMFP